jgi:FxsC-like protein
MSSEAQEFIFFFSHARDDFTADVYLAEFFKDLCEEVRALMGLGKNDKIGFRDTKDISLGQEWAPELFETLQHSQLLICIFTPLYFNRPWCGKEMEFFRLRQTELGNQKPKHPFVIPVCWVPADVPSEAAKLTTYQDDLPPSYLEDGLLIYCRSRNSYQTEYWKCVRTLASKIKLAARQEIRLPQLPNLPKMDELKSAFESECLATYEDTVNLPVEPEGPSTVHFYYAAGTRKQLEQQKKRRTEYYDEHIGAFWRPFSGKKIGVVVSGLAAKRDLLPYNRTLNKDFRSNLAAARNTNTLVVLIADAWTIELLLEYRMRVKEYDDNSSTHCTAFVIWNEGDEETQARIQRLQARVKISFQNSATKEPIYFRPAIATQQELETLLGETLERLRNRILENELVVRGLDQSIYTEKPVLLSNPKQIG